MSAYDRRAGVIIGGFLGDAAGAPFEGRRSRPLALEQLPELKLWPGFVGPAGSYTDDTELAIGILEELAERGRIDESALVSRWTATIDSRRGYGHGFLKLYGLWREGMDWEQAATAIFRDGSYGNGGAMRVHPLGAYYADDEQSLVMAVEQATRVSHGHPLGLDGARVQAAAVAAACRGEKAEEIVAAARKAAQTKAFAKKLGALEGLLERAADPIEAVFILGNSVAALDSVPTALYCALATESVVEAARYAICCAGDTDTIAAMAGAVNGGRYGLGALPDGLMAELEEGPRGRDYVLALCRQLWA